MGKEIKEKININSVEIFFIGENLSIFQSLKDLSSKQETFLIEKTNFSKNIHIMIGGKKAEVVGDICMDVLMVNINGINCDEGDDVTLFDSKFNAEDFAKSVGSISYEILTNLSKRIERKIIEL